MPMKHKWINKMQFIHLMEYHSAIKRNEALRHATMWVKPDQKMTNVKSHLHEISTTGKSAQTVQ